MPEWGISGTRPTRHAGSGGTWTATPTSERLITVAEAIDQYEADLNVCEPATAERLRPYLKPAFTARPVGLLTTRKIHAFRAGRWTRQDQRSRATRKHRREANVPRRVKITPASDSIHGFSCRLRGRAFQADVPCSYPMSLPPWWRRDFSTGLRDLRHSVG